MDDLGTVEVSAKVQEDPVSGDKYVVYDDPTTGIKVKINIVE